MWQITNNLNWDHLAKSFSWIRDMEGVPQDPIFHAEREYAVPTKIVMKMLRRLDVPSVVEAHQVDYAIEA